jgi:hypothetical protein
VLSWVKLRLLLVDLLHARSQGFAYNSFSNVLFQTVSMRRMVDWLLHHFALKIKVLFATPMDLSIFGVIVLNLCHMN